MRFVDPRQIEELAPPMRPAGGLDDRPWLAPIAIEAIERIDALFAIEREINGMTPQERLRVRNERSRSLVIQLESWLREQRARVSRNSETGKAIDYSLKRWSVLTRFLDDGRHTSINLRRRRAAGVAGRGAGASL